MKCFLNYSSSDLRVGRNDRNKVYIDYAKQKSTDEKKYQGRLISLSYALPFYCDCKTRYYKIYKDS